MSPTTSIWCLATISSSGAEAVSGVVAGGQGAMGAAGMKHLPVLRVVVRQVGSWRSDSRFEQLCKKPRKAA